MAPTLIQALLRTVEQLPPQAQREVLDFADFLARRPIVRTDAAAEEQDWANATETDFLAGYAAEDTVYDRL